MSNDHSKNIRIKYLLITLVVIVFGITSRKTEVVPLFFGDILYAVMVYFGLRTLFIHLNLTRTAIFSLLFCFSIEFQQLHNAEWLLQIRRTSFGHYALGQGFLWSDLGFYTLGVIMAYWLDSSCINKKKN